MRTRPTPRPHAVLGTMNNCASGKTPWGTYLSGEENWANYFTAATSRARTTSAGACARRAGTAGRARPALRRRAHPNEPNRFGWVVEVDPMDPDSTPVKRTALGRAAHEGAWVAVTKDGRAVVYSGEDARFEYIYKFVSRDKIARPAAAKANRTLLDHGTLYVARFDADGSGRWLPLVHGQGPLTAANGFADQGEVVIKARQASDLLGATKMDRPEWLAIDPTRGWVYCTLTNNSNAARRTFPAVDAANPRANNVMGQIIRWKEDGDFDGTAFRWNHLLLAGDPANERPEAKATSRATSSPAPTARLRRARHAVDPDRHHAPQLNKGEMQRMGNNQMLACDPATGEVRRFLTGPVNCEVTGCTLDARRRTMFVNIQHPGETPARRNDPPTRGDSRTGPDFNPAGRPRSATLAIRRRDGGVIGA
jgi:uncharacterized protein